MERRSFLLNFILWVLAVIFGYNLKDENMVQQDYRGMDKEKDGKSVDEEIRAISKKVTLQKYYVSISEFPRIASENDDKGRFKRAMESLPNGGKIICEVNEYLLNTTLTLLPNIILEGQGNGRFHTGTSFKYTGTGAAFNFTHVTAGIKLINFKIYTSANDSNYQNFTGIDVNRGELITIQDVSIENADIGIDCTGSLGAIYLLKIDNIFIWNCRNEGIYVRKTGNWKNGIYIAIGDVSDNGIGIRVAKGEGNIIEGKASELGRNRIAGIKLEGGSWIIKGALWMENNTIGFHVTGGNHRLDGDVMNIDSITVRGGSIINNARQSYVEPTYKGVTKKDLAFWYSFDEEEGTECFDRAYGLKATFTIEPIWNESTGYFRNTVTSQIGNKLVLPNNQVDWSKDWTILALGKGSNLSNTLILKGSDKTKYFSFRYYKDGCQLWDDTGFVKNFNTYPGVDLTANSQWISISYNSKNKKLTSYTNSGKIVSTFNYTMSSVFKYPIYVHLAYPGVTLDEFITYNRVLESSEIASITGLKSLPSFNIQGDNQMILKSPDGSRWLQTIDNNGVPKWVKI